MPTNGGCLSSGVITKMYSHFSAPLWMFVDSYPAAHHAFLKIVSQLRPAVKSRIPSWDLALVLEALWFAHWKIGSIESIDMKFLLYQTALLLALTTLNRVGDLHV